MPTALHARAVLILLLSAFGLNVPAFATPGQPGTLDATWGTTSPLGAGKVASVIPGTDHGGAYAMALQSDGKVVLAGFCVVDVATNTQAFCLLRYHGGNVAGSPAGTLDTTFNGNGTVVTGIAGASDIAKAIAVQPDGKIIAAGTCYTGNFMVPRTDFCVARYLANGALDTSFNGTGKLLTPMGSSGGRAGAVALQPDGKIVLTGDCNSNVSIRSFCTVRYLSNGSLDTSFNGTGKVFTEVNTSESVANAMTLQSDGKLIIAGYCGSGHNFCAARYLSNGTLDSTFSGNGIAQTVVGTASSSASTVAVQPDSKIVLAGLCANSAVYEFCALRYLSDGTLDVAFNGDGQLMTSIGNNGVTSASTLALTLQADGKLLIAGTCDNGSDDFCLVRYGPNGGVDTSFNGSGKVTTQMTPYPDNASALALQPDGKIVVAGYCGNSNIEFNFCAARYDSGPFGYKACTLDIDGDNRVLATTDMLIGTRVALGMTGNAVINGITFAPTATRTTWPLIRDYLVNQCGMALVP